MGNLRAVEHHVLFTVRLVGELLTPVHVDAAWEHRVQDASLSQQAGTCVDVSYTGSCAVRNQSYRPSVASPAEFVLRGHLGVAPASDGSRPPSRPHEESLQIEALRGCIASYMLPRPGDSSCYGCQLRRR